ncbi:MAG: hypothetical protein NC429_08550 [Lachnospiraceae bacterium]|nr:hypothetical protein [Lachnospiraceae bacterium]
MKNNKLIAGILRILTVNTIGLILGMVNNIVLPKFLSIDSYAQIKSYHLYYNFIGIFHLGTIDAVGLKYGGSKYTDSRNCELSKEATSIRIFLIVEQIIMMTIAVVIGSKIALFVCGTIFFTNLISYYKILFQATGEFKRYSRIVFETSLLRFLSNIILIFGFHSDNYLTFILLYVLSDVLIAMILEKKYAVYKSSPIKEIVTYIVSGIKNGFLLLSGNIIVNLLSSIDRWFVNFGSKTNEFAFYSFAVTIEQILINLTKPFQISLYNYFCINRENTDEIIKVRKYLTIISSLLVSCFFPIEKFVIVCLREYKASLPVLVLLFASQIWSVVVNSIYINLYKAHGKQNLYFKRVLAVVCIAVFLDTIGFAFWKSNITYAITTLISNIIWYIISCLDFQKYFPKLKEWMYIVVMTICFSTLGLTEGGLSDMLIYLFVVCILTCLLFKNELKIILLYMNNLCKKICDKNRY